MKNFWRNVILLGGLSVVLSSCGLLFLVSLIFFQPRGCWDICPPPPCTTTNCPQPQPESVNFTTDLRIFRGDWRALIHGKNEFDPGKVVSLTLEATYVDTKSYTVTGSFQVAGEAAQTLQGSVKSDDTQVFTKTANRTSPPPPPAAFAEFLLSSATGQPATQVLIICPGAYQGADNQWRYSARLETVTANRVPFESCYNTTATSQSVVVGRKPPVQVP